MVPNLFIVITDFNGFQQTKICLESLRKSSFQGFTIVVVDHGTTSETRQSLEREYPDVVRIVGSPELWWTGATNLGVRHTRACGAELVMLLNNDCYVTPETIGELIELWRENPQSVIAPVQRDWKTRGILSITPRSCFLLGFPTIPGPKTLTDAMHAQRLLPTRLIVGGRGVLIPSSLFQEIGLFDEMNLPHYGADHDFYLRAAIKKWQLYVATRALVDIDNTRTSMAENFSEMSFREWWLSLYNQRSHRNIAHVSALFKKHYPIKKIYFLGLFLYTFRYFMVFFIGKWRKKYNSCGRVPNQKQKDY